MARWAQAMKPTWLGLKRRRHVIGIKPSAQAFQQIGDMKGNNQSWNLREQQNFKGVKARLDHIS
ncbi:hypothetical protein ABWH92_01305 [Ahrensia marina]|uniref:hypothetical protein n=1 Tax=Ahrensia marina TaxID=1514904 RepID=UPI0035CFE04B